MQNEMTPYLKQDIFLKLAREIVNKVVEPRHKEILKDSGVELSSEFDLPYAGDHSLTRSSKNKLNIDIDVDIDCEQETIIFKLETTFSNWTITDEWLEEIHLMMWFIRTWNTKAKTIISEMKKEN